MQATPSRRRRGAKVPALSVSLLCMAVHSTFAQTNVANETQYNAALGSGGDMVVTGSGFTMTGMPTNPIGGNVSIAGAAGGGTVLNGNGGDWYAFTNFGSNFVLTSLSNITIENFGRVGVNNREAPVSVNTHLNVSNVRISNNVNSAGAYPGGGLTTKYLLDVTGSTFSNN